MTAARSAPATTLTAVAMAGAALWLGVGAGHAGGVGCTLVAALVWGITDAGSRGAAAAGAGGAILANGVACADATTANTDLIQIVDDGFAAWVAAPDVTIDLSGGPFAPGATDELGSSSDEIELHLQFDKVALPLLTVAGSSGADHVVAGAGGLNLNAGEPDDDVDLTYSVTNVDYGNTILDRLVGGAGDDVLSNAGGEGTGGPWLFSTPLIDGGEGNDTLSAGDEDALILGGAGNDTLRGGPDDYDELRGGPGYDALEGGAGDDILDGGPQDDWALYANAPGPVNATLPGGTAPGGDGHGNTDTYTSIERLQGSEFDDLLIGGAGPDHIMAGDGNDIVRGNGGDDSIGGGDGDDTIDGGPGHDRGLSGDGGNDTVTGGAGDDQLSDGSGDDSVFGGPGNDFIEASEWDPDLGLQPIGSDLLSGGNGSDTVAYWFRDVGVTITLDGAWNDGPTPDPNRDNVGGPTNDVENLGGSLNGNDTLVGNGAANRIEGYGGGDTLDGGAGKDELLGGAGADTLGGGEGKDTLDGGSGADALLGGAGKDMLLADDGASDSVDGGPGRDTGDVDGSDAVSSVEVLV